MIKTVTFKNVGRFSINSDLTKMDLPVENITDGQNFLIDGDKLVSSRRHDTWTSPPTPINAGHLQPVSIAGSKFWMTLGRAAINVYDGANWSDISSAVGYASLGVDDELNWNSAMLGSIPIINNIQHVPEYWSPQDVNQILQPLDFSAGNSWADVAKSFKVIRSHKTFLFALNLVEGGIEMPNSYRWSHPADLNGLPYTWDPTDLASIASIEQIAGDSGAIVDGLSLRDSFCIYSERSITILDSGNSEFVFRARELSSTYGLINDKCIVEVAGVHYFISDDDILRNDGNTVTSIMFDLIQDRFRSLVSKTAFNRSYVELNTKNKEIYFCLPEGSATYPNTAYVYNYANNVWSFMTLPDNMAHMRFGSIAESSAPPLTYASVTDTHNTTNLTYNSQSESSPFTFDLVGLINNGDLVYINPDTNSLGLPTNTVFERTDIPLEGNNKVTTLLSVYPHIESTSPLLIQFGSQDYANAPVSWKPAIIYSPSVDRKIDFRTTGSLHAYRLSSIDGGSIEYSGMTLEYASSGGR